MGDLPYFMLLNLFQTWAAKWLNLSQQLTTMIWWPHMAKS